MQPTALIDGISADASFVRERAFQFGDGLFETIAVRDGQPCLWSAHVSRLQLGCDRLRLPAPDPDVLLAECRMLAAGHRRAVIKIFLTAGTSARGYRRPANAAARRVLQILPWPGSDEERAWKARFCAYRLSDNPHLAGIKHLNRLDQVLARSEWSDDDIDEGIVCAQDGRVVSGTMSNLYLQTGTELVTPRIDSTGIAGVVRNLVLQIGIESGRPVAEARVEKAQLRAADAVFVSNSLIGIKRLQRIDHVVFDLEVAEHPVLREARIRCHQPLEPA